MKLLDQKICAWCGIGSAVLLGLGLLVAGFVPPPSPSLSAAEIAARFREDAIAIRVGMLIILFGIACYAAFVAGITQQLRRIPNTSELPGSLQLSAGSISALTLLFPFMLLAVAAFRPDRDPESIQLLNDVAWLISITAFPTFLAQWGAISYAVLQDSGPSPVYPRWIAFFNVWLVVLTLTAPLSYFFLAGPFSWNGLFPFWLAGGIFFTWMGLMSLCTIKAISAQESAALQQVTA